MTTTNDNTQSLPAKAGVYIIRDAITPSITLYVGIASNLSNRLNSQHHVLAYCRERGIDYTIDYELEPNEKKRKKREHQLISELNATLNDGGITQEPGEPTIRSSEPSWQTDASSLTRKIMAEGNSSSYKKGTPEFYEENRNQIDLCLQWLDFAWDDPYNGGVFLNYGSDFKDFHSWTDAVVSELGGWYGYLNAVAEGLGVLLNFEDPVNPNYLESRSKFWIEREPPIRGSGSTVILDYFCEAINGEMFNLNPPGIEKRFKNLLLYLNPGVADQWAPFKRESKFIYGYNNEQFWMSDIVQDFCDHALMWSTINNISLFDRKTPKELLFTKFFLENPYRQKHHIEDLVKRYISTSTFILAVVEFFDAYPLQYRVREDYNSRKNYLCNFTDLRLTYNA